MTDLAPPAGHHPAPVPAETGIDSAILIHAPQSKVDRVAAFSRNSGITAVYTVAGGNKTAAAHKLLTTHRSIAGPDARILFDANRYSGKNCATGDAPQPGMGHLAARPRRSGCAHRHGLHQPREHRPARPRARPRRRHR